MDGSMVSDSFNFQIRTATQADALRLSVLAIQVFLDTYATDGIRDAIAREVLSTYSEQQFKGHLSDPNSHLLVAESNDHLIGFAQITFGAAHPLAPDGVSAELLRLYVQEPFTSHGVGTRLLREAENYAAARSAVVFWLTPWVHNHRALAFYQRRGYVDHGLTHFTFEGEQHENRVYAKQIACEY